LNLREQSIPHQPVTLYQIKNLTAIFPLFPIALNQSF